MAYNPAIPAANDLLSQSQQDIQQNFAAIQTLLGINHINFGAVGEGKHLYLQLPEHAAPVTAVNEAGFYANVGATSTVTELFFRRENNGASIPMTERETGGAPGWTFLPSGIMLQFGTANVNNNTVVTLTRAMPTTLLFVLVSSKRVGAQTNVVSLESIVASSRTVNNNPTYEASDITYLAIGI
jgi:hypothetical protein